VSKFFGHTIQVLGLIKFIEDYCRLNNCKMYSWP